MIEETIELTEVEAEELDKALKENTKEFTILKLIEELAELQEKLIKFHLKSKSHKPKIEEILDEVGDVIIRMSLFQEVFATEEHQDYIEDRIAKKMKKLHGYLKEGKYKGGL